MLAITVHEIKGNCPVHKIGDKIIIENPEIKIEGTDALCTHALPSILHYALILEHDWRPVKLGLTKKDDSDNAYLQCLDPGEPYTEGGTVTFKINRIDEI
jgi:uncharacterized repeat protein (TIGR04076 family)